MPQQHKKGVTCISGIMLSANEAIFASTSSDGTVNIWEIILPMTVGGGLICIHLKFAYMMCSDFFLTSPTCRLSSVKVIFFLHYAISLLKMVNGCP